MGLGPGLSIKGLSDSNWTEYIMPVGDISLQGWRKVPQAGTHTRNTSQREDMPGLLVTQGHSTALTARRKTGTGNRCTEVLLCVGPGRTWTRLRRAQKLF